MLPTVASSPVALYSVVKPVGYSGPCIQVQRASDNATLDIGFTAGIIDVAAINAFGASTTVGISKAYDLSGSGNDATQTTLANQPIIYSGSVFRGIPPMTFDGAYAGVAKWLNLPAALSLARQSYTSLMAAAPRMSWSTQVFWEFQNAGVNNANLFLRGLTTARGVLVGGASSATSSIFPLQRPGVHGVSSSASARNVFVNGTKYVGAADTALTMNSGGFIGKTNTAGGNNSLYNGLFDLFGIAFYPTALSDVDYQAVQAAFTLAYRFQTYTKRVVYGGSSLIMGRGSTLGQTVVQQEAIPDEWDIVNVAISSQTLATEYANRATIDFQPYDPTKLRNVLVIDAASNDIAAGSDPTTVYNSTALPFKSAALTAGFNGVVIPTIIDRTDFDATKQINRLAYNSLVVAGAAGNGYICSDRAGNALLGATGAAANLTYFNSDGVHPTNAGYAIMAPIDRAAILAA